VIKIINDTKFQRLWTISKDKIEDCKFCEYRYACFDTRKPKLNKKGNYYMEKPCKYIKNDR